MQYILLSIAASFFMNKFRFHKTINPKSAWLVNMH